MQIRIFNNFNSELETLWLELEAKTSPYVFQTYRWLEHWQLTIGDANSKNKLSIVVLLRNKIPHAIIPLKVSKYYGTNVLKHLGEDHCDYNSILATDIGIKYLRKYNTWKLILSKFPNLDVIRFANITEDTLRNIQFESKNIQFAEVDNAFTADLPKEWSIFEKQIKRKIILDSKRQRKRLTQKGELRFEHIVLNNEKAKQAMQSLIEEKRQSYKKKKVKDILSNNCNRDFYINMPWNIGVNSKVHLSVLLLNEVAIASHWGVVTDDRFYYLMPTYAEKWNKYSAGRLLLEELIKWAIINNIKIFDFTIGNEKYKQDWCNRNIKIYEVIQALNYKGIIYKIFLELKRLFL